MKLRCVGFCGRTMPGKIFPASVKDGSPVRYQAPAATE
jgi:hypothetical protein